MYKYQLQPYKGMQSRYRCPSCNHHTKCFTRYVDTDTGEDLAPHVGICDRVDKCGYHFPPKKFFELAPIARVYKESPKLQKERFLRRKVEKDPDFYINPEFVNDSFRDYDKNYFVTYLINRFGLDVADRLVGLYRIGTSDHWFGATVFWQMDGHGHVRTGKIMLYDRNTGKRVKQPYNHITWAHAQLLKTMPPETEFKLNQCLFGEHLLIQSPYKPVAIVESEKTAIIATAMMPAFIWLACGSLEGLNVAKCSVLQNRQVMLFPDVNSCQKWQRKAMELRRALPGTRFEVSTMLEERATTQHKKDGADIGDVVFG